LELSPNREAVSLDAVVRYAGTKLKTPLKKLNRSFDNNARKILRFHDGSFMLICNLKGHGSESMHAITLKSEMKGTTKCRAIFDNTGKGKKVFYNPDRIWETREEEKNEGNKKAGVPTMESAKSVLLKVFDDNDGIVDLEILVTLCLETDDCPIKQHLDLYNPDFNKRQLEWFMRHNKEPTLARMNNNKN
jgi:hypothetical protein